MSTTAAASADGVRAASGASVLNWLTPSGTTHERGQLGVAVEHAGERVVEHGAVVEAGAHHDLAVDLDAVVEQGPQPAQAGGPPAVAQHLGPHVGVGGVDRHVAAGLSRSVTTRSRSASVKRVRVVKFP